MNALWSRSAELSGGQQGCQEVNRFARRSTELPGGQQGCQEVNRVAWRSTGLPGGQQNCQEVKKVAKRSTRLKTQEFDTFRLESAVDTVNLFPVFVVNKFPKI